MIRMMEKALADSRAPEMIKYRNVYMKESNTEDHRSVNSSKRVQAQNIDNNILKILTPLNLMKE
jgi:hypothetical protein